MAALFTVQMRQVATLLEMDPKLKFTNTCRSHNSALSAVHLPHTGTIKFKVIASKTKRQINGIGISRTHIQKLRAFALSLSHTRTHTYGHTAVHVAMFTVVFFLLMLYEIRRAVTKNIHV